MALYLIYLTCLFFSLAMAFASYRDLKNRQLFLLAFYLLYVCIQEAVVFYIRTTHPTHSTAFIYNLYRPISVCFFVFFFYRIPFNSSIRKLIVIMAIIFFIIACVTFLYIQPIDQYNPHLSLASGIVITFYGIFFLFHYFNLDNRAEEDRWKPMLWISIGIVAFYPVVNISYAFYELIRYYKASIFGDSLYASVPRIMSIFMYSCFTYAFYLCRKKNYLLS
jgi:hypothetical protein